MTAENWCYDNCRQSFKFRHIAMAPMLHDCVWLRLAAKHERLCFHCMLERAKERKVRLNLSSLRPCPWNLDGWPYSWFNFFAAKETPPTRVSPDWHEPMDYVIRRGLTDGAKQKFVDWLDEQERLRLAKGGPP